jgi:hypothetical protein
MLPRYGAAGRMEDGNLSRVWDFRIGLLTWLCLLLLAGCSTPGLTPTVRAPAGLPKPDRVLVHDFEVAPAGGALNYEMSPPAAQAKPHYRHIEQQMPPPTRSLDQPQRFPLHQRCGAAEHRVSTFHRLDGHTGSFGDGDTLAYVMHRERCGNAATVCDVALLICARFPSR